jgi:filamentous hemagglutinin
VDGRHRYTIDEHGRITSVKSTLRVDDLDTGIRNCYQQGKTGSCGLPDDEGGHLIATKVGGPGEKFTLCHKI